MSADPAHTAPMGLGRAPPARSLRGEGARLRRRGEIKESRVGMRQMGLRASRLNSSSFSS
jgi:hypothetical protein